MENEINELCDEIIRLRDSREREGDRQFMRVMRGRSEDAVIIKPKEWPAIRDAIDAMVASAEKMGDSK